MKSKQKQTHTETFSGFHFVLVPSAAGLASSQGACKTIQFCWRLGYKDLYQRPWGVTLSWDWGWAPGSWCLGVILSFDMKKVGRTPRNTNRIYEYSGSHGCFVFCSNSIIQGIKALELKGWHFILFSGVFLLPEFGKVLYICGWQQNGVRWLRPFYV